MSSLDRLTEITHEVFDKLFDSNNNQAVKQLLTEVLERYKQHESDELAMYLRASSCMRDHLDVWDVLLATAVNQAQLRGEDADDIFFGMLNTKSQ